MLIIKDIIDRIKQIFSCRFLFDIRLNIREKAFINPIDRIGMHRKALRVHIISIINLLLSNYGFAF